MILQWTPLPNLVTTEQVVWQMKIELWTVYDNDDTNKEGTK
jgi:hypothetical protein